MMNKKAKRILVSCLSAGMLLGSVPAYAQSEAENEATMIQSASAGETEQAGFAGEMAQNSSSREANGPGNGGPGRGQTGGGNRMMGGGQAATDPALQTVIDENSSKFDQYTYTDEETGVTLEYSLYIPEGYEEDAAELYPMVMFIPDATGGGKSASQIVEGY